MSSSSFFGIAFQFAFLKVDKIPIIYFTAFIFLWFSLAQRKENLLVFSSLIPHATSNMIQATYLATSKKGFSQFVSWSEVLLRSLSLQETFPSSAIHHSNFTCSLQLFSPWVGEAGTVIILFILYKVKKKRLFMDNTGDHPCSKKN